jgi:AcrR family transcriptional regulator
LALSLLSAGRDLLDIEGIEGVTIRACARATGVSHAAPAKHYADRRALLTALAIDCMADMDRDIQLRIDTAAADPREQLAAIIDASVGYALVHPHRYRLMWRSDLLDNGHAELDRLTWRIFERIGQIVAALPEHGKTTPETRIIAICSMIHGYISMRIDRNFRPASDEAAPRPRHLALVELLLAASQ